MKVLILWVPPAERRFGSGDELTAEQLAEFGVDAQALVDACEAQVVEEAKPTKAPAKATREVKD